jgi:ATP-dependent helicase/nuclease subunit B
MERPFSPVLHILPTGLRVDIELRRQLPGRSGALLGHKILTFPQLIDALARDLPTRAKLLPHLGQILLLREYLAKKGRKRTHYFRSVSEPGRPGLSRTLLEFFGELKQALIWPDEFARITESGNGTDKQQELAGLYQGYTKELEKRGLIDEFDRQRLILEALRSSSVRFSFLEGVKELRMDDIYNPSRLQFEIVLALAESRENARVTIPYNPQRQDAFRFLEGTVRMFELLGEKTQRFDPVDMFTVTPEESGGLLPHILANIFKSPEELARIKPLPPDGSVRIVSAQGLYREVEETGREIRRLLNQGVSPEQIGVVFRDLSEYGRIVEDVFNRFGLPLYFRRGNPLISSPLIKTILTVFEIIRSRYARDLVLKFLNSNYVRLPGKLTHEGLTAGELETIILESGMIDAESLPWEECLRRHRKRLERKLKGEGRIEKRGELERKISAIQLISKVICQFVDLLEGFSKPKSLGGFLDGLKKLLDLFSFRSRVLEAHEPEILRRDLAALNIFEELLGSLSETLRESGLEQKLTDFDDFSTLLLESLSEASLPDSEINRSGIKVLHVRDTIGLSFDYLVLGGLTDGQFPEKKYESPIFTDTDKAQFNEQAGRAVFHNLSIRHQEEPLLFYLVLTTARKRLYLTYSTLDSKGNLTLPSTLLKGLLRLIDTPPLKEQPHPDGLFQKIDFFSVPKLPEAYEKNELRESLVKGLYQDRSELISPELYLATFNALVNNDQYQVLKQELRRTFRAARIEREREKFYLAEEDKRESLAIPWTGRITSDRIIKQINQEFICGKGVRWSPTLLEIYAQCPFRFLMGVILGMAELPRPEIEPDRMTEGSVLHDILRVFYQERFDQGKLPLSGSEEEGLHLEDVCERVFPKWELKEHLGSDRFWTIKKEEILRRLRRFIRFEAFRKEEFSPVRFELSFGSERSPLPPVVIQDESGLRVELKGKIDRLDISADDNSFRVVDYKNSRDDYGAIDQKKLGQVSFQIPVYLLAGEMLLQETGKAKPISGRKAVIYLLKNPKPKKVREASSDDLERFKEQIVSLIQRASSGIFDVSPFQDECSPFCEFRNICRYQPLKREPGEQ